MKRTIYIATGLLSLGIGLGFGYSAGQASYEKNDPFRHFSVDGVRSMQESWGGVQFIDDEEGNIRALAAPDCIDSESVDYFVEHPEEWRSLQDVIRGR